MAVRFRVNGKRKIRPKRCRQALQASIASRFLQRAGLHNHSRLPFGQTSVGQCDGKGWKGMTHVWTRVEFFHQRLKPNESWQWKFWKTWEENVSLKIVWRVESKIDWPQHLMDFFEHSAALTNQRNLLRL